MKAQELKAFIAICKYGSFTTAADKLFMTQPTISWLIQSLEKELGQTLFVRGKGIRQISLTRAGQLFYPQAEQFLQLWTETDSLFSEQRSDSFSFACTSSVVEMVLPKVHQHFRQVTPDCSLNLDVDKSANLFNAVERGGIDCALVCQIQPTNRVNILPFASEKQVFVCRTEAQYPEKVDLSHLRVEDQIFLHVNDSSKAWQKNHFPQNSHPLVTVKIAFSVEDYFLTPDAWCIMPISRFLGLEEGFRICEMDDLPANRMFYLVSKPHVNKLYYTHLRRVLHQVFSGIDGITVLSGEL